MALPLPLRLRPDLEYQVYARAKPLTFTLVFEEHWSFLEPGYQAVFLESWSYFEPNFQEVFSESWSE